jgi:hypothetical protein
MGDVVVVTMSEFGRTAKENGNRGTDHGHANCMFVMGGDVKGGRVFGTWPGLAEHQLNGVCVVARSSSPQRLKPCFLTNRRNSAAESIFLWCSFWLAIYRVTPSTCDRLTLHAK